MLKNQKALLDLLSTRDRDIRITVYPLSSQDLGSLFVDVAFLASGMQFFKEEHWLQSKKNPVEIASFKNFVSSLFQLELSPLDFLRSFFESSSLAGVGAVCERAKDIENVLIDHLKSRSASEQKIFAEQALQLMSGLFLFESDLQNEKKSKGLHLGLSMYRTFDRLDSIFDLNYQADHGMKTDLQNHERLYEGAGVGVQSGYSTVLTALYHLNPRPGARIVDLGSGYGRVGLVVGLMRPDIDFKGYEFVEHRVDISSNSSAVFGLENHVHFYTQDLSLKEFQIPDAEIYYMYDPFSKETYAHVLSQLVTLSRKQPITIATKGNAKEWLMDIAKNEGWPEPRQWDDGNLCIFKS